MLQPLQTSGFDFAIMRLASVNALYIGSDRGLAADLLTARAHDVALYPIATALVSASHGHVTDLTDVPADTVAAQLEHLGRSVDLDGMLIGALAGPATATTAFEFAREQRGPVVLNLMLSGPSGETVLSSRGIDIVREHLDAVDLVIIGRLDAELLTEGEITSLDDAQVAAQRLVKRGARGAVIRCGALPARFFEIEDAERPDDTFNADLYYDGAEFALYEAPHLGDIDAQGASGAFGVTVLVGLVSGLAVGEALASAKRFVSEALRSTRSLGPDAPLQYFWQRPLSS